MAYKSSARTSSPVIWIVGHTAEGARSRQDLGAFFYQNATQASSHVGIDAGGVSQYVAYNRSAWTLRNGNSISDNAEICGFANFTRSQWLGSATVNQCPNPRQMVRNFSDWARNRCVSRGIPMRKLTVAQTANHASGLIGHVDYTNATGDGTHTDPGPNFPWDVVLMDMIHPEVPMADSPAALDMGYRIFDFLQKHTEQSGGPSEGDSLPMVIDLSAAIWRLEAMMKLRGSVYGGPTAGEPVALTTEINNIKDRFDDIESKMDLLMSKVDGLAGA